MMAQVSYYKTDSQVSYLLLYILATYNITDKFGLIWLFACLLAFYPFTFLYFMLIVFPLDELFNKIHPKRRNF